MSYNVLLCIVFFLFSCNASVVESQVNSVAKTNELKVGAQQLEKYLPLIKDRSIAIVANQTSQIDNTHLVDTLLALGINVKKIFAPEHGFRGKADAGEKIADGKDIKTGLPILSLYGKNRKPSHEILNDIDLILFDIQDVGLRFYTYISTMTYVMETAADMSIPFVVLDRPNPHAHYIDGPLMEDEYTSFVGLHNVPVAYGMTIGEYAKMVVGESWLDSDKKLDLTIIPCENYDREVRYELPISPSPNLPNALSIQLYPSLCFFEGTTFNEGRGTDAPFQRYGHTDYNNKSFAYMPKENFGAKYPKFKDEVVFGKSLSELNVDSIFNQARLNLNYVIDAFDRLPNNQTDFFLDNNFFEKLAGTKSLRNQILAKKTEKEIRDHWQSGLNSFQKIREKYLLY